MLKNCSNPDCGIPLSVHALTCPKCEKKTAKGEKKGEKEARKVKFYPCRSCGASLNTKKHLSTYVTGGEAWFQTYDYDRAACPECGDPTPLYYTYLRFEGLFATIVVIMGITLVGYFSYFADSKPSLLPELWYVGLMLTAVSLAILSAIHIKKLFLFRYTRR